MRPPGPSAPYYALIGLGVLTIGMAVFMTYAVSRQEADGRSGTLGPEKFAAAGALVALFGVYQLRRPVPLDAPPRRSRLWLWALIAVLVLLAIGGGLFFFAYFLQEML